ncbi:hypothetical protein PR002_g23666 [Phytophthora rubi]|uniref:RxLR effector protein n=1 Tax=Phytophthora rubi TaxID=129364 RepID=A0A6A3IR24_9STRA|nr:hypothetical protein PR002_g23666 [Phytophthora rubi]
MRLSYVVLAAATALVLTPVSTAATSDAITGIAKPKMHLSSANEDTRNDRRFLSVHKVNNGEDKEERGWSDWAAAKAILLKLALADNDGKARIISEVRDPKLLGALFSQAKSHLEDAFPAFREGMHLDDFYTMLKAANLNEESLGMLYSAYVKYWTTHHFPG